MKEKEQLLQNVLTKLVDNKKVFGTSFCVRLNGQTWLGSSGNIGNHDQYFIASTTKLFVTAIILNLKFVNKLNLDDKISEYLDDRVCSGLNIYNGMDYSDEITIKHLLSHNSGLTDYFEDKNKSGISLETELKKGIDRFWTFEDCIEISKSMPSHFRPGQKGKAHYADTNFQLLGKIIEQITGKTINENFESAIIKPLNLENTYLYNDINDSRPKPLYYKDHQLLIPKAMTSFGPDGGIVSTSAEMMIFIEAFFNGKFFPKPYINDLQQWNRIFFPMQSGVGIQLFKLPWIFNPTGSIPELIGHSGLSGALAYYSPKRNLYITGTVNQVAHPDTSFKTAIQLIQKVLR
jgi:CubicO group peptidase (beta-lactamase class C family)